MPVKLVPWDFALMAVVTVQATLLAYLDRPKWKALILSLPVPFTLAVLAVGQPVGLSNVIGLLLLLFYTQGVRILHAQVRLPIVPSIAASALGYCLLAALILPALPQSESAFWAASLALFILAFALLRLFPERSEPAYRSSLPVYLKAPILLTVIFTIVALKSVLQGFMTLFPMVGVVASYEARHSLWTIGRQIPILMIAMIPMICTIHLAQPALGIGLALIIGWIVYLAFLTLVTWGQSSRSNTVDGSPGLHTLKIFR